MCVCLCVSVCVSCRGPSFVTLLFSTSTLYFPLTQEIWLFLVLHWIENKILFDFIV